MPREDDGAPTRTKHAEPLQPSDERGRILPSKPLSGYRQHSNGGQDARDGEADADEAPLPPQYGLVSRYDIALAFDGIHALVELLPDGRYGGGIAAQGLRRRLRRAGLPETSGYTKVTKFHRAASFPSRLENLHFAQ